MAIIRSRMTESDYACDFAADIIDIINSEGDLHENLQAYYLSELMPIIDWA